MSGMKGKTIAKILKSQVGRWIKSIEDEKLRELVSKNTIVTGGSIASMLLGEDVNDYDIYFKNNETAKAVADYYVEKFQDSKKTQGGIPVKISVDMKSILLDDIKQQVHIQVK